MFTGTFTRHVSFGALPFLFVLFLLAANVSANVGVTAFGVTTANQLVSFYTARPNTILSTVTIMGLQAGENILGINCHEEKI